MKLKQQHNYVDLLENKNRKPSKKPSKKSPENLQKVKQSKQSKQKYQQLSVQQEQQFNELIHQLNTLTKKLDGSEKLKSNQLLPEQIEFTQLANELVTLVDNKLLSEQQLDMVVDLFDDIEDVFDEFCEKYDTELSKQQDDWLENIDDLFDDLYDKQQKYQKASTPIFSGLWHDFKTEPLTFIFSTIFVLFCISFMAFVSFVIVKIMLKVFN